MTRATVIITLLACVLNVAAEESRSVFPPLRHGVKAVFGENGNDHGGDLEGKGRRLVEAFHDLDVDLTRIEFKWAIIEPTRGTYDWSEPDRLINFLNDHGIEPMLMLYCAPKWAMRGTPADEELFIRRGERNLHTVVWPRREFLPDFERFCETAARRYAGKARLFEFWNEPDGMAGPRVFHDPHGKAVDVRYGGEAAEYTLWLQAMYAAVKRGNPAAQIAAGSLCVHTLNFIEAIYAAGGRNHCDAISLHPYAGEGVNLEWIRQVRDVMTRYGDWDKPIWLTEFGWTHGSQYDEDTGSFSPEADRVARIITDTFPRIIDLSYVTHSFFFTLNDWTTHQGGIDPPGMHAFGIMDLGFHRRPGFEAFRQVVAGTSPETRSAEPPTITVVPPSGPVDTFTSKLRVPVTVMNPFPETRSINVSLEVPELLENPVEQEITAKPGATRHTLVARIAKPPTYNTTRATIGSPGLAPVETWVTATARAARVSRPPTLDADLEEWTDALNIEVDNMKAGFTWDDKNLYFACRIIDQTHQQPHQGRDLWKGDCVQLAVDPRRDAVRGSRYDVNDSEFALALPNDGPVLWRYICPLGSYVGAMPAQWVAADRRDNETLYEAAIPWSELRVPQVNVGRIIGVAVAGCDWTGDQRVVHRFGDGIIGTKEPGRFASIRLVAD